MPRYLIEHSEVHTVHEDYVPAGMAPGDTFVVTSVMGLTARNERHAARIAFDGWIMRKGVSAPTLVSVKLAPPRVS